MGGQKMVLPITAKFHLRAAKRVQLRVSKRDARKTSLRRRDTHFFMIIHRSEFPIVCDSSLILNVAVERSGVAPASCIA